MCVACAAKVTQLQLTKMILGCFIHAKQRHVVSASQKGYDGFDIHIRCQIGFLFGKYLDLSLFDYFCSYK